MKQELLTKGVGVMMVVIRNQLMLNLYSICKACKHRFMSTTVIKSVFVENLQVALKIYVFLDNTENIN